MDWGEKFNSNGATLVVKERGRSRVNGQTVITYNLFASGLPKDSEYTLWTKLVGSKPQAVADAFINNDGLVVNVLSDPVHSVAEDPINSNYSGVFIVVTGLQPKEEFQTIQQSGREGASTKATAAEDGSYKVLIFPFVKGQSSGKLRLKVSAKTCAVGLEVPWGQGSYAIQ